MTATVAATSTDLIPMDRSWFANLAKTSPRGRHGLCFSRGEWLISFEQSTNGACVLGIVGRGSMVVRRNPTRGHFYKACELLGIVLKPTT
jgi:hypothetical protein